MSITVPIDCVDVPAKRELAKSLATRSSQAGALMLVVVALPIVFNINPVVEGFVQG